jgi:hypothetical protein
MSICQNIMGFLVWDKRKCQKYQPHLLLLYSVKLQKCSSILTYPTVYGCRSSTSHTSTCPHHPVYEMHIYVQCTLYLLILDDRLALKLLCPVMLLCSSETQKPETLRCST